MVSGPPLRVVLTEVVIDCSALRTTISHRSLLIKVFLDVLNLKRNWELSCRLYWLERSLNTFVLMRLCQRLRQFCLDSYSYIAAGRGDGGTSVLTRRKESHPCCSAFCLWLKLRAPKWHWGWVLPSLEWPQQADGHRCGGEQGSSNLVAFLWRRCCTEWTNSLDW